MEEKSVLSEVEALQQIPLAVLETAQARHQRTVGWLIVGWAATVIALIVKKCLTAPKH